MEPTLRPRTVQVHPTATYNGGSRQVDSAVASATPTAGQPNHRFGVDCLNCNTVETTTEPLTTTSDTSDRRMRMKHKKEIEKENRVKLKLND
jgi:hypothetical protein